MALNISKTKYVVFHNKGKNVDLKGLNIVIDENRDTTNPDPAKIHILERVHKLNPNPSNTSFKLLEIHLDENLPSKPMSPYYVLNCPMPFISYGKPKISFLPLPLECYISPFSIVI
jgi:hypothetical protein